MSVDNQTITIDSATMIAANVEIVAFNGNGGVGIIEYNDRPRILDRFLDPSTYDSLVDTWIAEAEKLIIPLTLSQAKAVKNEYIDALYHHKRQAPYSLGGYNWDARDEAVADLQSHVNTTMYVSHSGWTGTANWQGGGIQTNIGLNPPNGIFGSTNGWNFSMTLTNSGDDMNVIPIGGTAVVGRSYDQIRSIINGISARHRTLNGIRVNKQTQVDSAVSIADVIAVSAISGW